MKALVLGTLTAATVLALGSSASAVPSAPAQPSAGDAVIVVGDSGFDVASFTYGIESVGAIALGIDRATQVEINLPAGYTIDLARPLGTEIGQASGFLVSATSDASASAFGSLVVDDPAKYTVDDAAQACAPGTHAAVWRSDFSVLGGRTLSLLLFVDAPAAGGYVVRLCPQWPPSGSLWAGVSAVALSFYVLGLRAPTARGVYVPSALVTPAREGSFEPDAAHAYEMRVTVPVPHLLTLHAKFDTAKKTALLSGHLTAQGVAEAGVPIQISGYTGSPSDFDDSQTVRTNGRGAFSIRVHVDKTTRFSAEVADARSHACSAASTAPGGCIETEGQPAGAIATVILRGARDPRFVRRKADQGRATRTSLKLSDFGEGWLSFSPDPFESDCPKFKPNLSDLTTTGEASSPAFYSESTGAGAYSEVSVYATVRQAQTAFTREAQIGEASCYADDLRGDPEIEELAVSRISFPRYGDQTKVFRVSYGYEGTTYAVDFISLRSGRLVAHLLFGSIGGPLATEREVVAKLAARAGRG